jgi:TRAP transporter TAXI family solute receptor
MVIMIAGTVIAYQFIKPAPPRHIVLATGPEQGAYAYYGRLYRDRLQREGISVTTESTRGSIENIELLRDQRADVAFVQGGAAEDIKAPHLRSLASLYLEPIWIFVRKDASIGRLSELRGRRVALDKEGSGTRAVMLQLLADNHIRERDFVASSLGGGSAAQALHEGKIDAASFVIAPSAGVIQDLLAAPDIALLGVNRAAAYRLRHRFLSVVTLPEGAADLAGDVPSADITLLATAANLVVRDDFHPALAELMLRIAKEFHSEAGLFEKAGEFPSRKYLEYPISEEARRFFDAGPSLLQRYLPFWAANLIDRLKIMLLPLITLVYPLFKLIPPTYDWRMKSRINRWYKDLQAIEQGAERQPTAEELKRCLAELDRIERIVQRLSMPVSYANPVYTLRLHIALLRGEIREAVERRAGTHGAEKSSAA